LKREPTYQGSTLGSYFDISDISSEAVSSDVVQYPPPSLFSDSPYFQALCSTSQYLSLWTAITTLLLIYCVALFFRDQSYLISFWLTNYFTTFEKII